MSSHIQHRVHISDFIDQLAGSDDLLRQYGFDPAYIHSITLAAWAKKRGANGLIKTFKKRFVVLVGATRLDYHETDSEVKKLNTVSTRKGSIGLTPLSTVSKDPERDLTLLISKARPEMDRTYIITFDSPADFDAWYDQLTNRIHCWALLALRDQVDHLHHRWVEFEIPEVLRFRHPATLNFERVSATRIERYVADSALTAAIVIDRLPYSLSDSHESYGKAVFQASISKEPQWKTISSEMIAVGPHKLLYYLMKNAYENIVGSHHVFMRSLVACHVCAPRLVENAVTKKQNFIYIGYQFCFSMVYESESQWRSYEDLFFRILDTIQWSTDAADLAYYEAQALSGDGKPAVRMNDGTGSGEGGAPQLGDEDGRLRREQAARKSRTLSFLSRSSPVTAGSSSSSPPLYVRSASNGGGSGSDSEAPTSPPPTSPVTSGPTTPLSAPAVPNGSSREEQLLFM